MIRFFLSALYISWLTLFAPELHAQPEQHTLGELWPVVEKHYPGIGAKISAMDAAKFGERAVRSDRLPQVKAQAQNTYATYEGSAGAFFPQPGFFNVSGAADVPEGSSSMAPNSFGSATVEWELFSFGRLHKRNEAASARYRKRVSEKEAYILHLKKVLSERYISLLYNDARLNLAVKNTERLDDIRHITSGLSAAGIRPAADSLLASSSYVQSRGEYDRWSGYRKAALIRLLELYPGDTVDYGASSRRFSDPAGNHFNGENTVDQAHPALSVLNRQSEYYALSGKAQKRASLPSLRLIGGYAYRGTGIASSGTISSKWRDGFSNTADNILVGIGITWNITGLHSNRLKGESLFKAAESTKLLRLEHEQAMQAGLSASRAEVLQQYERLQKTSLAVKQSQEAYGMYLARYKTGLIALSELLQIRSLLEQAEGNHIEASRDYWMLLAYEAELTADFDFLFNNL
ncbi:TolC family protein [Sinomicrobium soli]|uniref:TolC family protein n=1 Tax=Sinomicrobium sp. N-1-3-6 TaxID=2219864 RepID=UPI000DCCF04F|nr:TolC family protein [Sinomicrobium sp. N-1-3-6]RAV29966.1 TolC family protein [Sinomicrobium sp. N-1-3-6]